MKAWPAYPGHEPAAGRRKQGRCVEKDLHQH